MSLPPGVKDKETTGIWSKWKAQSSKEKTGRNPGLLSVPKIVSTSRISNVIFVGGEKVVSLLSEWTQANKEQ